MKNLLWIDLETTGLDPNRDKILEFGAVVTDTKLNEVSRFRSLVHCDVDEMRALAGDYVQRMHEKNELWRDLANGYYAQAGFSFYYAQPIEHVQDALCDFALAYDAVGGPACGASVHFNRSFLKAQAPRVDELFNHRVFDTSTIRAWLGWQGTLPQDPPSSLEHRALPDILGTIDQMRGYRGIAL